MAEPTPAASPPWSNTTKLVVALTVVAIIAGLLIRFHNIVGPLLIAFTLAYLLHPVASLLSRSTRISWRAAVNLIYLLVVVLLVGLLTLGGLGLVQQIQSLITLVNNSLEEIPALIEEFSGQIYQFGPFTVDLRTMDLNSLSEQFLSVAQTLLGRTGSLISTLASGAAQFFGWGLFVLLVSYFVLTESGGLRERILTVDIPGYNEDVRRLSVELGRIWNAFLRGQIIIFVLTVIVYSFLLSVLGVRYSLGLALLAGLAKFLPYVGPAITWIVFALVAYFQTYKLFAMPPLYYMLLVVGIALFVDQIFDNLISPRIMAQALRIHPAGVLVAAIVAASLLGLLGVIIAAPMLATIILVWNYALRKLLDLDPWPEEEVPPAPPPGSRWLVRLRRFWRSLRRSPRRPTPVDPKGERHD